MGSDYRKDFIIQNLDKVIKCTIVGIELLAKLCSLKLIDETQLEELDECKPNTKRAKNLYMLSKKWNDKDFLQFVNILNEYGNTEAYKIFTTKGAPVFLLEDETGTLERESLKITESGCYEGISMEDEMNAQTVLSYMKDKRIVDDGRFILDQNLDWNQLIPSIKNFTAAFTEKRLWFNPWKPQLPLHYIDRKYFRKISDKPWFYYNISDTVYDNDKIEEERLVLIVDAPGMGKSCVLTELENDLRQKLKDKQRLILRINLNRVIQKLFDTDPNDFSLAFFLKKYATFIPPIDKICTNQCVPVFIFLDGLDEVLPKYKEVMLNIISSLLSDENQHSISAKQFFVKAVVVTTRPHLKDLIEKQFKVSAYCLIPLYFEEQVDFMFKIQNGEFDKSQVEEMLKTVRTRDKNEDLMGNPLMLTMYAEVLPIGEQEHDKFSLYSRFMEKRHMHFLTTKKNMSQADPSIEFELKSRMENSTKFYYFLSVQELIDPDDADKIVLVDMAFRNPRILENPTLEHDISLLVSYGVVVKSSSASDELKFSHRSFAEFFYAKMLTDIERTSQDLRNILFAVGYGFEENIADFVCSKLKTDATILPQLISKGWSKYFPEWPDDEMHRWSPLRLYQSDGTETDSLIHYILSNTLDYEKCAATRRMLVMSCYDNESNGSLVVVLNWLRAQVSKGEKGIQFIRNNVFQVKEDQVTENIQEVVVAIALAEGDRWNLSPFLSDREVKLVLLNCPVTLRIAVCWEYLEGTFLNGMEFNLNNLLERFRRWLTDTEIVNLITTELLKCNQRQKELGEYKGEEWFGPMFMKAVLLRYDMCWFLSEQLGKTFLTHLIVDNFDSVADITMAVSNSYDLLRRVLGANFFPELLFFNPKFRFTSSLLKYDVPDAVIDSDLWRKIEEYPDQAISKLKEDSTFEVAKALETSLIRAKFRQICEKKKAIHSKSDGHFQTIYFKRKKLFQNLVKNLENLEIAEQRNLDSIAVALAYNWPGLRKQKEPKIFNPCFYILAANNLFYAAKCLILSAERLSESEGNEWLHYYLRNKIESQAGGDDGTPFLTILLAASAQELTMEMKSTRIPTVHDKTMVSEVSVWDVLMRLILKNKSCYQNARDKITRKHWRFLIMKILSSQCLGCYSEGNILHKLKGAISDDQMLKSILLDKDIIVLVASMIRKCWKLCYSCLTFPPTECPCLSIVSFYIDTFKDDQDPLEWVQQESLLHEVPVEILVAAQDKYVSGGCATLLPEVQRNLKSIAKYPCQLKDIHKYGWTYKRECEWMHLLRCFGFPELRDCDPVETEKVNSHYLSALLNVWVCYFGQEQTRTQSDALKPNEINIWEEAHEDIREGELLHTAVKIGSLTGVKLIAWPGVIGWKNEEKLSACDVSKSIWGPDDEITRFLKEKMASLENCD